MKCYDLHRQFTLHIYKQYDICKERLRTIAMEINIYSELESKPYGFFLVPLLICCYYNGGKANVLFLAKVQLYIKQLRNIVYYLQILRIRRTC